MKKQTFMWATLCCLITVLCLTSRAQLNYIVDPSFEDTTATVNGSTQMSLKTWRNLDSNRLNAMNSTYFSYVTQNPPYSLPDNQWVYQHPRSGGGVAELSFIWTNNPSFRRAIVRTKIKIHLTIGKTYCAKMYVNAIDKYCNYFTDGIAMYFDNGQLDTIATLHNDTLGIYPFVNPQVSNPSGNVLSDTMNWVLVSGTFVATGNETFLTIGNFKTDANTIRVINPAVSTGVDASSLLIDDVSLIEVTVSNWLQDKTCVLGDSVYIGLPKYEVPDAQWYDINMVYIGKGSGLWVTPTQGVTKYIQVIDVCSSMRYDTVTVWSSPEGLEQWVNEDGLIVFPNPTNGKVMVKSEVNLHDASLEVYDFMGKPMLSKKALTGKSFEFDMAQFASGVYFIELNNRVSTNRMKFIKN